MAKLSYHVKNVVTRVLKKALFEMFYFLFTSIMLTCLKSRVHSNFTGYLIRT